MLSLPDTLNETYSFCRISCGISCKYCLLKVLNTCVVM